MDRPSLPPALAGLTAFATTIELGPHATSLILALANIAAATVLAIVGQRVRASVQKHVRNTRRRKQVPRRRALK